MKTSTSKVAALVCFLLLSSAMASMAAWSTDMGDQLVLQSPTSHLLYHSSCNTSTDLVFPVNDPFILETEFPPKEHGSLAGVGWFDAVTTWACLWYQDSSNNLVYARYECNATSGAYALHNSEIISTALPDSIALHNRTALSAVLLGAEEGIRVYAHDEERRIHELSFHNPTGWLYGGSVADQPGNGLALASAASAEKEVTVIVPGEQGIQVLHKDIKDTVWDRSTTSISGEMASFPSNNLHSLALTTDEEGSSSLFYIGTDARLHHLLSPPNSPETWVPQPTQPRDLWPKAHTPSVPLTITSRRGARVFTLYYQASPTEIASATFNGETWSTTLLPLLPPPEISPFLTPDPTTPRTEPPQPRDVKAPLSKPALIALCTILPVVVVLALCAACLFTHRRRQAAARHGPRRAPSRTRPRSTDLAFRHVRPYSEFGELSWEDGVSEDTTTASPWRRKRGWTC
ncbi:hypothetical protein VD0002_g2764 [Verticillium dahliae]|uniref:Fucose-specific lectin n=2 Tax=Verticillium dahliae TaxID=27337 RepID=G2XD30_VERDV|nr:uncharacterized protein VDAG_08062 [Verticillium dahliae VdLs.17]KAH6696233.1 hypothetical protein EV126DRAFT_367201 [Verticillium dahliae]EGY16898.1 hypothetical protein VDAG_08062 [Verticillium dahliae VdLs.17]PNH31274.1 hypothetical protein BJF96_g5393 [Verticillium dahliae]PNH52830.1 hypothetical protein VD0003_g4555 [Verticillium dahliae]PNH66665.1 hypothetical protein VD0002_g2764 [Verticillium dahliae]